MNISVKESRKIKWVMLNISAKLDSGTSVFSYMCMLISVYV